MSSTVEVSPPLHHYRYLDGIRAYLALYVVASHCFQTATRDGKTAANWIFGFLDNGHFAVCFFIVLSGFCLTLPTLKSNLELVDGSFTFFKRRAWRILPPYYCALLFSLVLVVALIGNKTGTHWDLALPVTWHSIITHLLLIQNFFSADISKINHVMWSIAVEWQVYFLFPLLLWSMRRVGVNLSVFFALAGAVMGEQLIAHFAHTTAFLHFFGLFALGVLAASLSFSQSRRALRWSETQWLIAASVFFLGSLALASFGELPFYPGKALVLMLGDVFFGVFGAIMLIIASVYPRSWIHQLLSLRLFAFIGTFSYSLYLVHAPIVQILWQFPLKSLQNSPDSMLVALLFVGILTSVSTSYLFFLAFERPFLHRRTARHPAN